MGNCLCTHFIVITVTAAHGIAAVPPEREQYCLCESQYCFLHLVPRLCSTHISIWGEAGPSGSTGSYMERTQSSQALGFPSPTSHYLWKEKDRVKGVLDWESWGLSSDPTASPIPCASPSWFLSLAFSKLRRLGQRVCIPISGGQARSSRVNAKGRTARKEMRLPRQQNWSGLPRLLPIFFLCLVLVCSPSRWGRRFLHL